jgi:hypothetical protein
MPSSAPLALKPDIAEAARRFDAYFAGELIDRPIVLVTAPRPDVPRVAGSNYRDMVFGDVDDIIRRALTNAEATYWGGEAVPAFYVSFGPDEIAAICGAGLGWHEDYGDTNWSIPCVEQWEDSLPIAMQENHPLWQRMLATFRRASELLEGKMLVTGPDLHTNMDLLSGLRGPQRLCMDLIERPEAIDRAMADARAVFRKLWSAVLEAGRQDERGHCAQFYSMEGAAILQCDFCCMIGPSMFRRWVLPALEEEAGIVRHAYYHWDGPGAIAHTADLCASKGLHTLSYVPGDGHGSHLQYLDLFKRVQSLGKAVHVWGSQDEVKMAHRELRPEKAMYTTWAASEADARALLDWFVRNT